MGHQDAGWEASGAREGESKYIEENFCIRDSSVIGLKTMT